MAALDMPQDMPDISMPELEDEDIDQLARFIYQVHEYLSGGLHYSAYQEK